MNFLVLPLYRRADAMQAEERDQALRMKPWVDHIKKTFKGDERFMMLQTYYRQVGYKQTDALKGSVSLLLEIPFFIAAYQFLSHLQLLQGVSFGPIADLSAPDGLLKIGSLSINVLPILMTLINIAAAAIYMKGFPLKNKIQMYGMALVFLVLLYTSPSGLVFYWTLNNVFSLFKNIFYKMKNPKLVLCILASAVGLIGLGYVLFVHPMSTMRRQLLLVAALLLLQLPLVLTVGQKLLQKRREKTGKPVKEVKPLTKAESRGFLYCCIFLAILTGVLIPSAIIHASPEEFINLQAYKSPLWYILSAALTATGTFVVWFGIFYRLAGTKGKRVMNLGAWVVAVGAAVNYMFFGKGHGNLSEMLQYDVYEAASHKEMLINLGVLIAIAAVLYLIWKKKIILTRFVALAMCLAVLGMSVINITGIQSTLAETRAKIEEETGIPQIHLSKKGKNVIVFMLDRAINSYFPFIVEEKPELKKQFEGFTYYPNTISYGGTTIVGAPALFGGYEYRPASMIRRTDKLLTEKYDESLKVMPVIFDENDFEVTVCDPPLAGFHWVPDLSIYDDYWNIKAYNTIGAFTIEGFDSAEAVNRVRDRNFFCFSMYRIAPVALQSTLYNRGKYNATETVTKDGEEPIKTPQERDGLSKAEGVAESFMKSYAVLSNLSRITEIDNSEKNTFLFIDNDTTHSPNMVKEPEYEPAATVDNTVYDAEHATRVSMEGKTLQLEKEIQVLHYQVNAVSLLQLGKWLDYLREQGVYDNTRIIVVSDHGFRIHQFDEIRFGEEWRDLMCFNPLLLVKDFNSNAELTIDRQFMTNADTPTLAMQGLIENPINPFTGNPINSNVKQDGVQYIFRSGAVEMWEYTGTGYVQGQWARLNGDDAFNMQMWKEIDESEVP